MAQITITIPNEKVQRVLDSIAGLYPIPRIPDPNNPGGTIPQFTKAQWAREWLKRTIRRTVARYETEQARISATVPEDQTIVDVA